MLRGKARKNVGKKSYSRLTLALLLGHAFPKICGYQVMPFPFSCGAFSHRRLERTQLSYGLQILNRFNSFSQKISVRIAHSRFTADSFQ